MKTIIKRFSCVFLSVLVLCSFCCVPLSVSAEINKSFDSSSLQTSYGEVDNNLYFNYMCEQISEVNSWFQDGKVMRVAYEMNGKYYLSVFHVLDVEKPIIQFDNYVDVLTVSSRYYKLDIRLEYAINKSLTMVSAGSAYQDNTHVYFNNSFSNYFWKASQVDNSSNLRMIVDFNFENEFTKVDEKPVTNLTGMYLDRDTESWQAFLQWLIDTGAVNELAKFGISNGVANLTSVADVWWNNKFSPTLVFELLKNNGLRTVQYAKDLISWFNNKWYEFQTTKYVSVAFGTPGKVDPHHRAGLIDDEVDENGNITDDTTTSLLREILRQITLLPSYFYKMFAGVIDNIANNVYSLNLYMSDFLSYLQQMPEIILKLVDINDTLQNLDFGGGSSILPGSSSYNEDNLFTFLDIKTQEIIEELDYQLTPQPIPEEYSLGSVVGDKFAFVKQIRDYNAITYDYDFFNDSLIDTNDGLQNVLSADVDVLYLPVAAAAPVPNSSRAVMYAGVVSPDVPSIEDKTRPDFNFNFGGLFGSEASVSVLDFSIFDEYKHLINVFLVALCWSAYLRRLYKKLPELLRSGVYDVSDSKE